MYKYTKMVFSGGHTGLYRYNKVKCDYFDVTSNCWSFTILPRTSSEIDISRDEARKLFPEAFKK